MPEAAEPHRDRRLDGAGRQEPGLHPQRALPQHSVHPHVQQGRISNFPKDLFCNSQNV